MKKQTENKYSVKVLQARHDRLLELVHVFWNDFITTQDMVYEYRDKGKITQVEKEKEGNIYPWRLGRSLLEDVFLPRLPTTDEEVDEDNRKRRKQAKDEDNE